MATFLQSGPLSPVAEDGQDNSDLSIAQPPLIARFEMAITAGDLKRLYPYIPGGQRASFDGRAAILNESPSRGWRVLLKNYRTRAVGQLRLPLATIEIEAWGYEKSEFERFLDGFHLAFRRGGG